MNSVDPLGKSILTEREKLLIPTYYPNYENLADHDIELYMNVWGSSELIEITNKKLKIKPHRYDPP